jgi:hypothetical protein
MGVLSRLLRYAAIVCSLLVVVGWGWFAYDQTAEASANTQQEIDGRAAAQTVDPSPDVERDREHVNGPVHEAVDDANDVLLRPFAPLVENQDSKWARRTIPAALALLIYGFGFGVIARFLADRR